MRNLAIKAQFSHEFIAIHLRHENIGNDQIRFFFARYFERLRAVLRLKQAVAAVGQHRHQSLPIGRAVIDDENRFHA